MKSCHRKPSHVLLPLLLIAATSCPAQATSEGTTTQLPEVLVSAERAETVLRKTPVSVGVVGRAEIDSKGMTQLSDLVGVVAGVTVPNGFSNMPQAVGIRGVGVSIPAMSQAVGIYVDDVPLIRGYATALWDLPDIGRIEVLRGPQGTLYGQNASAGAVKVVSLDPSTIRAGWLSVGAGNHGMLESRGYLTQRLGESGASASIAFSRRLNDGFGYNASKGEAINRLDATQWRAKLKLPLADWTAVLSVDGLLDKSDSNTINFPLNHPRAAPRVSYTTVEAGEFRRQAGGLSLKLTKALDSGTTLRAITGYRHYTDDPTRPDWGGLEQQRYTLDQVVEQRAFSQEIQLQGHTERLSWTTGAMLVKDEFDFHRFLTAFALAAAEPAYTEAKTDLSTTDVGIYGQGRLALGAQSGLTIGLRGYRTRQTGNNELWRTNSVQQRTTQIYQAAGLATVKTGWLPRIGVDHQLSASHFLYAGLAQGAKFGGFNRAAESLNSARQPTQPEQVTSYELGSKHRLVGGHLTANAALFYNDYRDYLAALSNTTVNGVLVTDAVLTNAGKAKTFGLDLELAAKLTQRVDWTLSVEFLGSRFDEFANPTGAASSNYVGNHLPYAPKVSLGSTLSYRLPLQSGAALQLDGWLQHLAKQFADVPNTPALALPAQTYLNIGGAYISEDRHWTFSARVQNLQNKTYVLLRTRIPPLGVDSAYYNAPRTLLLSARYDI